MKEYYEQPRSVMPTIRKIGMAEMRDILGAITTSYDVTAEEWQAYNRQREEHERLARESLTAYYVGRMQGVIEVGRDHDNPSEEEVRYRKLLDGYTQHMIAVHSVDQPAEIIEVNFGHQAHFDETA